MLSLAIAVPHAPWMPERADNMVEISAAMRAAGAPYSEVRHEIFAQREPWIDRLKRRLGWAVAAPLTHFLQLEDDVLLAPHFFKALGAMHRAWPTDVICLASTHPLAPLVVQHGRRSYRTPCLRGWAWSCPMTWAGTILEHLEAGGAVDWIDRSEDDYLAHFFAMRNVFPRHPVPTPVDHRQLKSTAGWDEDHTGTTAAVTWRAFAEADMVEPEWWRTPVTCLPPDLTQSVRIVNGLCVYCGKRRPISISDRTLAGICKACIAAVTTTAMGVKVAGFSRVDD